MRTKLYFVKIVFVAFLVIFCDSLFASDMFMPCWKVGDSWQIVARYRSPENKGSQWLKPVTWQFKVRSENIIGNEPCFVLQIAPVDRFDLKSQAVIYLAKRDLRVLKVIDIYKLRGKARSHERVFDQVKLTPLIREDSIVPYDLPLFPLCAPMGANNSNQPAVEGENAVTSGNITFIEKISQTWLKDGNGFKISLKGDGIGNIEQKWVPGKPWAVSMKSSNIEYELVK